MAAIPKFDNDMIVSTLIEWQPKIFDNITNNNPLLRRLRKGGHIKHVAGGLCLEIDVMYKNNDTGRWFLDDDALITTKTDTLQALYFDWYYYNMNMVIWGTEWARNKGSKTRKYGLLEARKDNMMKSAQNDFGKLLWTLQPNPKNDPTKFATEAVGPQMFGVPNMVSDDNTITIGGLDCSDIKNAWWRNQSTEMKEADAALTGKVLTRYMADMVIKLTRNGERPTICFMSIDMYTIYQQYCEDMKRITTNDRADGSFKGLDFQGIEVLYDPNILAGHVYFLNENYIKLNVHPDLDFKLDVSKKPTNQYLEIYPLYFMGGFTISNRKLQGVLWRTANKYMPNLSSTVKGNPGPGPAIPFDYTPHVYPYDPTALGNGDKVVVDSTSKQTVVLKK
jgi:hypothetical protein